MPWAWWSFHAGDGVAEEDDDDHGTDGGGDDDDDDLLAPDPRILRKNRCQGGGGDPKNDCGNKENAEDQGSGHVYIVFLLQDFFYHFVAKYWLNTADLVHHETKRLIFQIIESKRPVRQMVLPKSSKQTKTRSVTEQFHFDAKLWKQCC